MSAVPLHRQPRKAEPATAVVIVGSGFAAFECARRLARRLDRARASDVRVTIVSPVDYMQYSPLLADVAGGLVDPRFVCIPLAGTLKGVQAVRGRVDSVDFDRHLLSFTDPEGRVGTLSWDRLVLTPGSVTRLFDTPGLATHARGLKSTAEALYLRDRVLEQLELAHVDENEARAAARRTIVVVGASYSGSELTAQLRALADAAAKQMGFDRASVRFVLLDLADHVMPEVGQKLGDAAMRVLRSRGIDVRLGTTLKEVYADHVVLTDDSRIGTYTVAWVAGVTPSPLIATLGLETERGRLKVQADLQVPGHPDVFAAGDAAAVPDLTQPGKIAPPTAQHATRQGKTLARNVAASLGYGERTDYRHSDKGLVVDLGPRYAVANPLGVHLSGYPAKLVARAYHLYALPRLVNRWAVALAYLTDVFFPAPCCQWDSFPVPTPNSRPAKSSSYRRRQGAPRSYQQATCALCCTRPTKSSQRTRSPSPPSEVKAQTRWQAMKTDWPAKEKRSAMTAASMATAHDHVSFDESGDGLYPRGHRNRRRKTAS